MGYGKQVLHNAIFAVSGGILLALLIADGSKKKLLLCGAAALAAMLLLGLAPSLYRWLRARMGKMVALTGVIAVIPAGVHAVEQGNPAGAAVLACVVSLPSAFALAAWLLESTDTVWQRRCRTLLQSRGLFGAFWLVSLGLLVMQAYFAFANGYIWKDESFTLQLIRHSVPDIIRLTAEDVHPPLYYLIVKAVVVLLPGVPVIPLSKLVSLVPYAVLLAGAAAVSRRGGATRLAAGIFSLCLGGMPHLLDYGTEIRMYSWGLLFVTVGVLAAWDAAATGRRRSWALLVVSGLAAAYTHYFACVAVAIGYLALLLWEIQKKNRTGIYRWLAAAAITVVAYLPWLFVLIAQVRTVKDSYWIAPITRETVAGYLQFAFGNGWLWLAVLWVVVLWAASEKGGVRALFAATALLCPLWIALVGVIASLLLRPVFIERYLVPGLGCLWLGVAVMIAVMRSQRCKILLVAGLCAVVWSNVRSFAVGQQYEAEQTASTLEVLETLPADAILIASAQQVQLKLAGLSDHACYGWQLTASALQEKVYSNARSLMEGTPLAAWEAEGRELYFFEDQQHQGSAAEAAAEAGLQAVQVADCGLCEPLTVWRLEAQ